MQSRDASSEVEVSSHNETNNNMNQTSIGKEAAVALFETKWWEGKSDLAIALFQLSTAELCCPFDVFHGAVEKAIGRPVWTHEFINIDGLYKELTRNQAPPSMDEIMNLLPKDKTLLVVH